MDSSTSGVIGNNPDMGCGEVMHSVAQIQDKGKRSRLHSTSL